MGDQLLWPFNRKNFVQTMFGIIHATQSNTSNKSHKAKLVYLRDKIPLIAIELQRMFYQKQQFTMKNFKLVQKWQIIMCNSEDNIFCI